MAINLTSGNLNQYGNAGQFETDRSTWGFTDYFGTAPEAPRGEITRSISDSHKNSSCAQSRFNEPQGYLAIGRASFQAGKKYTFRAWVKAVGYDLGGGFGIIYAGPDDIQLGFDLQDPFAVFFEDVVYVTGPKTLASCKDNWQYIEMYAKCKTTIPDYPFPLCNINTSVAWYNIPTTFMRADEFEIYEYEDVVYTCVLDGSISTTNASGPGTPDGTATLSVTAGNAPYEYSKDNGVNWQSSPFFAGLLPGIYTFVIREQSVISCVKTISATINSGAVDFDWTYTKSDETVIGEHNGRIEITPTVVDTYTYSTDAGATYQDSNIFTGLAPGTYNVVVKRTSDNALSGKSISISPGAFVFERVWWSKNPVIYQRSANTGWGALPNVRLYDDVRVDENDNGIFVSVLKTELPPEENGSVVFQVRQAFRNVLKANPPTLNTTSITRLTDRIKFFKHYTGQLSALQVTPTELTDSLPHLVMMGGLGKYAHATINFFGSYLPTKKKFLSWAPLEKQVDRNQEDYLNYFVFNAGTTSLKVKIKAYYDDGEQSAIAQIRTNVKYGQLFQIPTGPSNSGVFGINPEKNLLKYELSLLDQNDALISEVRTFLLDPVTHPRRRLFMFLNSLGSYEVLRFYGVAERSVDILKEEIAKFLPYNYNALDGEREVNNATMRNGGNFSSGYFDDKYGADWLEYMKDFLLSSRVFEVTDGRRLPVTVAPGSFAMGADQNYERYIRFSLSESYDDESFTPKL